MDSSPIHSLYSLSLLNSVHILDVTLHEYSALQSKIQQNFIEASFRLTEVPFQTHFMVLNIATHAISS
jgi:hypothetical protein